jgi:hypothetical protein
MSFDQAVADFPTAAINTFPPNVPYTPWHLLEHLRIAQWDILEFIQNPNHVSPEWPVGYWPDPTETAGPDRWQQTIRSFLADLQSLRELVQDPETDLFASLAHAPGYTICREILVVSDHNAYHIGEFAILRQVMGTWPAERAS